MENFQSAMVTKSVDTGVKVRRYGTLGLEGHDKLILAGEFSDRLRVPRVKVSTCLRSLIQICTPAPTLECLALLACVHKLARRHEGGVWRARINALAQILHKGRKKGERSDSRERAHGQGCRNKGCRLCHRRLAGRESPTPPRL